jgi:hypothetical protein
MLTTTYDRLYTLLSIENSLYLVDDLEVVARIKSNLQERALGRAGWLVVTDRFRSWIRPELRASDFVLVNGYLEDALETKASPLSILCASLMKTIASMTNMVVLAYFCGMHGNPDEWNGGPTGMLRCLIAQLILASGASGNDMAVFPGLNDRLLHDVALQDLGALWVLFQELLGQIPPGTTVFIILDGISTFETSLNGWDDEFCKIIFQLQQLVSAEPRSTPVLKVLLTAPNRSIKLFWQVDSGSQISLSAGNVSTQSMHQLEVTRDITSAME